MGRRNRRGRSSRLDGNGVLSGPNVAQFEVLDSFFQSAQNTLGVLLVATTGATFFDAAMKFYWFVLGALAVWRVTHLLAAEDGPWDLIAKLRRRAGMGFWGKLLDCFYCLSIWVSAPIAWLIADNWREALLLWPALSGAAILAERAGSGPT